MKILIYAIIGLAFFAILYAAAYIGANDAWPGDLEEMKEWGRRQNGEG